MIVATDLLLDGDKKNNEINNLVSMSRSMHLKLMNSDWWKTGSGESDLWYMCSVRVRYFPSELKSLLITFTNTLLQNVSQVQRER
jgi:hypothetical protein